MCTRWNLKQPAVSGGLDMKGEPECNCLRAQCKHDRNMLQAQQKHLWSPAGRTCKAPFSCLPSLSKHIVSASAVEVRVAVGPKTTTSSGEARQGPGDVPPGQSSRRGQAGRDW